MQRGEIGIVRTLSSCSFRKDHHGGAPLHQVDRFEDRFQTGPDIFTIQKKAVNALQPQVQHRHLADFLFGQEAGRPGDGPVEQQDVIIAAVIGNV